ncbi:MAG: acyl-CoA dehydrogenase family protein [Deltaproteobacteria bacterium]|nr:acyl-CoA dehydrogenase family protein [Deltaproteobacteria bacterium]
MDLNYTPEEQAFRLTVRQWIESNAPEADERRDFEVLRAWQRRLYQAGYLGAGWPREYSGAGLSAMEQAILNEELAQAGAPAPINAMAIWWVGPAIIKYGTEEQKQRFLAPILSGDEIWATGYSEPGAGSDMAAAKCKAERDGDEYVVNGQKVWTTLAHISDWYFILVRTSAGGPKWAGLTMLLIDLKSPGIEVRPIRQLTGDSEFNEVFLYDVRVPVSNRLGAEGQGWEVVSSALINERSGIAGAIRADQVLRRLLKMARSRSVAADPIWRQRLSDLAIKAQITKSFGLRAMSDQLHGRINPHMSAAMKLFSTELGQRFSETGVDMLGPYAELWEGCERVPERGRWHYQFLYDRSLTIAGGTSEVQRNIVAQRVLGLPRGT